MKKNLKRAGAVLVTLALCAGMMPAAFAATEPVKSWNFSDGTVSSWAGDAGWSNGTAPNTTAEEDMLTATFAEGDNTWKQNTWTQSYGEAQNLSEVCEVEYDLYAPSGITYAGIVLSGASTFYQVFVQLSTLTGEDATVGEASYTKYNVVFSLDGTATANDKSTTVAEVLAGVTNIRIFLVGGTAASGELVSYVDNISLNKEAAEEEPVGDYLYYNAGPVKMTLPSSSSRWPSTTVTIDPAVTVYPGAVVEYDVTLENNDFAKFYTEPKFGWTGIANMTVTPRDLTDNGNGTYSFHFKGEYDVYSGTAATTLKNVKELRIQFQNAFGDAGADYDYKGEVKVTNIKVTNGEAPAPAETAAKATSITGTMEDNSLGYYVDITPDGTTDFTGAKWRVTNSDSETADKTAAVGDTTTETTVTANGGSVRFGLVITAGAIGENTITKVEFIY